MAITSISFIVFIFANLLLFYMIPKRFQWCVLLVSSIIFYIFSGVENIFFVLITATTIYLSTRYMCKIAEIQKEFFKENKDSLSKEEKAKIKRKNKTKRKCAMLITLFINIGMLCVFKYTGFIFEQVNTAFSWFGRSLTIDGVNLIVPLGISFYTFQSIGYLVDVYWEHYHAEKNYFKVLLYVSFFPQITQGPISDFSQLSRELFKEHEFKYKNYAYGFQRLVWGFLKKMLIADILAPYVKDVFLKYNQYSSVVVLIGALMYSVQIYADFSGYMDIMCGYCEMLDIKLTENFVRPYFSKSIAEYWRRWHISLGDWFKKYIYYPIGMSTWSRNFAKNTRGKFGKHFSDTMPATIALIVTWLATGLWHGASWEYIFWGLVNGLFIILSLWLEPVYTKCKNNLKINDKALWWKAFRTLRTFFLVTLIKTFPEVGGFGNGFGFIRRIFTNFSIPKGLENLLPFIDFSSLQGVLNFLVAVVCIGLLFGGSLIQRKQPVRNYFNKAPMMIRIIILVIAVVLIIALGVQASWSGGGFMYAGF